MRSLLAARFGALLAGACVTATALAAPRTGAAKGSDPFPVLLLAGTAPEIGVQHGRALRVQIAHNATFYLQLLAGKGLTRAEALRQALEFEPALARHAPHLLAEMRGIAAGAGRPLAEILVINARTELLSYAARDAQRRRSSPKRQRRDRDGPGCTSVALVGPRGALTLGQNWDWRPEVRPALLRIRRRGAPEIITLTEAGMVAKIGCNARRVGVCLNFLRHRDERAPRAAGVPVHVLLRLALEARSLAQAVRRVSSLPRSASANLLLAQHTADGPRIADLELTPSAWARLSATRVGLIHANHFLDPTLRSGCARRDDPTTLSRQRAGERLARALLDTVRDPLRRAKRVLADRSGSTPISRDVGDGGPAVRSFTRASVLMSLDTPGAPAVQVAGGPPHRTPYVRYPGPRPARKAAPARSRPRQRAAP